MQSRMGAEACGLQSVRADHLTTAEWPRKGRPLRETSRARAARMPGGGCSRPFPTPGPSRLSEQPRDAEGTWQPLRGRGGHWSPGSTRPPGRYALEAGRPHPPASSVPSSPASPQARARPQPSRAATKAAAASTRGPRRVGRLRPRPPPPLEPPRCPAAPGDRKRPSRSRFMAAAAGARPGAPPRSAAALARLSPARLGFVRPGWARLRSRARSLCSAGLGRPRWFRPFGSAPLRAEARRSEGRGGLTEGRAAGPAAGLSQA